eukprot:1714471-Pyramimonas_sp.AAC.1
MAPAPGRTRRRNSSGDANIVVQNLHWAPLWRLGRSGKECAAEPPATVHPGRIRMLSPARD